MFGLQIAKKPRKSGPLKLRASTRDDPPTLGDVLLSRALLSQSGEQMCWYALPLRRAVYMWKYMYQSRLQLLPSRGSCVIGRVYHLLHEHCCHHLE
jgi:hypothetical protein